MDISIEASNGHALSGQFYSVAGSKAVIIMIHGIGDHISRFKNWAERFNQQGYSFIGVDLPGHGNSPGKRGHIKSMALLNSIIDELIVYSKNELGDIPVILYGHSMGGTIALNYLSEHKNIQMGIITSPWLKLSFDPPKAKMVLASIVKNIFPSLTQPTDLNTDHISQDKKVVDEYRADPLVHSKISVGLFSEAFSTTGRLLQKEFGNPLPVLLMHGESDEITSPEGSKQFSEQNTNVHLKLWQGGYHELHNETFKDEVFAYIIDWLNKNNS